MLQLGTASKVLRSIMNEYYPLSPRFQDPGSFLRYHSMVSERIKGVLKSSGYLVLALLRWLGDIYLKIALDENSEDLKSELELR